MEVAVLGATPNGRAIVGLCALAGHTVHLHGSDANEVMDSIDAIEHGYGVDASSVIDGTTGLEGAVAGSAVVVDATEGTEKTRRELLADAEDLVDDDALIVVSGSADSVTAVIAGLRKPDRGLGLHFVTPDTSNVVEVVVGDQTTESTRERGVSFVSGLDCTPLTVRDVAGFVSVRLELALVVEAIRMVEEGVAGVVAIDRALELGRDHPQGPLALADEMGLENALRALDDLATRLDGRYDPPQLLREKVADGELGKTTGQGFYAWENGERADPADPDPVVHGRPDQ